MLLMKIVPEINQKGKVEKLVFCTWILIKRNLTSIMIRMIFNIGQKNSIKLYWVKSIGFYYYT